MAAGLEDAMVMTGHRDDMKEILSVSDVVLSLSKAPESFGRTTAEALSMGSPVCGYAHGGGGEQLNELLPLGRVAVGDIEGVIHRVQEWWGAPPVVPKIQPYTLKNMLASTIRCYEYLVSPESSEGGSGED